jgi:uncharacterized protein DUF6510
MDAVDGNAIGGLLIDVFGTEMTAADSTCGTCRATRPVAELVVYQRAPGAVVRCRTCGSVLMVFVRAHDVMCVSLAGLASLGDSGTGLTGAGRTRRQPGMPGELLAGTNSEEGAVMSHEESMSMGTPEEEPMMMRAPEEEPMMMRAPDEESMTMHAPDEKSMTMHAPDEEPMMMRAPDEESMTMHAPDEPR